jgi:16S rRNA (adenine1518-N6/adenine1519-N6)-dimethyltransferase
MNSNRRFRIKKKYGQHFLINENIANEIVRNLDFQNHNQIFEIGPGTGVLSKYLIKHCDPILIEIDKEAVDYLKNSIPELKKIILGDFLKIELDNYLKKSNAIIGNFPYNISTQILFKILEHKEKIQTVIGMFQKEVAERICSHPNNKKYGIISVLIQAYYNCEIIINVSKENFTPPPKVESSVIKLRRNSTKTLTCNEKEFISIVKMSFNQRRKKIRNSLKNLFFNSNESIDYLMEKRPEELSVNDFILLTKNIIR